jgi:hypothetical protein
MKVSLHLPGIKRAKWHEWVLRFVLGGAVTVATGLIAHRYGPVFGGLFLAFPSIFPAGVMVIEKHETEKKRKAGFEDPASGRKAAALEARGAIAGAAGLAAFALLVWLALPTSKPAVVLAAASALWLSVALLLWWLEKKHFLVKRPGLVKRPAAH